MYFRFVWESFSGHQVHLYPVTGLCLYPLILRIYKKKIFSQQVQKNQLFCQQKMCKKKNRPLTKNENFPCSKPTKIPRGQKQTKKIQIVHSKQMKKILIFIPKKSKKVQIFKPIKSKQILWTVTKLKVLSSPIKKRRSVIFLAKTFPVRYVTVSSGKAACILLLYYFC